MPVYKKGEKYRIVVWHGGIRHDFILSGTKKEADTFEANKRLELNALDPSTAGRLAPTFAAFSVGAYEKHAERHLKTRTWKNRKYQLEILCDHIGALKVSDISTGDVERFKNARLDAKIRASTINDDLKVLRAVLSYARDLGIPVGSPKIKNVPTHGVTRRVQCWTKIQVGKLYKAVREKSPEILGLVVFLLNTGCRKGEALALDWAAVDTKRRIVRIVPSEEWQPKNGEARELTISDALLPFLLAKKRTGPVFLNRRKKRYSMWPQRAFDRAREAAGLTGGPHTTRHTFATHFLASCPDLFLLAKLLGHGHAYVTELYSHLLPDHLRRARNVVNFAVPADGTRAARGAA